MMMTEEVKKKKKTLCYLHFYCTVNYHSTKNYLLFI